MSSERDETGGDRLGTAAEEAGRLVMALRDLVTGPGAEHLATGSAECQVCPFCRMVALLREADPAAVGRAAEGLVSVVGAAAAIAEPLVRSLVDSAVSAAQEAATAWPPTAPGGPSTAAAPSATEPAPPEQDATGPAPTGTGD